MAPAQSRVTGGLPIITTIGQVLLLEMPGNAEHETYGLIRKIQGYWPRPRIPPGWPCNVKLASGLGASEGRNPKVTRWDGYLQPNSRLVSFGDHLDHYQRIRA